MKSDSNKNKTLVIVNRYDGIDLPDDSCRILVIDSLPNSSSLDDRYEELCRGNSDLINIKIAQKIEQGLGRSVRGEKDYSVIVLIGSDITKFVKSRDTKKYFSEQSQKQIDMGIEIAEMARNEVDDSRTVIKGLINQCLCRDESWNAFYHEEMSNDKHIDYFSNCENIYKILMYEKEAETHYQNRRYDKACEYIQKTIDLLEDDVEKGWYLQTLARYKYPISEVESNITQLSAFRHNYEMLKPKDGICYEKMSLISDNRVTRIKKYVSSKDNFTELRITVDNILGDLNFGVESEKFEKAIDDVGILLGFETQRPDKTLRKGPDNLWKIENSEFIMFECKSQVLTDRKEISKEEAGQMNSHCGWFEQEYGKDINFLPILIIPTKKLSYSANFTHNVRIMRSSNLNKLKKSIKMFIKEFEKYELSDITSEKVNEFIYTHKLDNDSLKTIYVEEYYDGSKK